MSESDEETKGVGAHMTWIVLGVILLVVLAIAYRLHGFWWQS